MLECRAALAARGVMINSEVSLELAKVGEAATIARLSRDLIERGLRWSWTPQRVTASIHSRDVLVLVARAERRIAGFAIMRYGDEEAHLDLLGVDARHRRRAVGRRLVEWLEKVALGAGIPTVFLEVRANNQNAHAFYETLGYRKLAFLAGYYDGRESAIRMGRDLGCA